MCYMWALGLYTFRRTSLRECVWPWALGETPHVLPTVASIRMGDEHMIDLCVLHGILFCHSVLLLLLQSLDGEGIQNVSFELGFKLFFTFPSLGPYCFFFFFFWAFDLVPPSIYPLSRLSVEETSSFWRFLHASHSKWGRGNKTNPTASSGAWSQALLLIRPRGGQISLSPSGPHCPSL